MLFTTGALQGLILHRRGTCEKNTGGFTVVWYSVKAPQCGVRGEAKRGKRGSKEGYQSGVLKRGTKAESSKGVRKDEKMARLYSR